MNETVNDTVNDTVVALAADLIFAARIRSTAEAANVSLVLAKDPADFLAKVRELSPRLAVLDLDRRGLDVRDTVAAVGACNVPLLAYVSHVQENLIAEAKDAGATRIVARGAFARNMSELLS
ncbi:MAG TPA: hypothetical protein VM100_03405 [Longimicrobiales bacterium]|nr:hypothetical protein [Longimicrobiales bacterium]